MLPMPTRGSALVSAMEELVAELNEKYAYEVYFMDALNQSTPPYRFVGMVSEWRADHFMLNSATAQPENAPVVGISRDLLYNEFSLMYAHFMWGGVTHCDDDEPRIFTNLTTYGERLVELVKERIPAYIG